MTYAEDSSAESSRAAETPELVHSLEKGSIASLLDEDTSSKVLITGDLNAGKSTFCNALLRRKVLPEDQQPCTAIFCEVLDARENAGLEEKIVIDNETYGQCKIYVKDIRQEEIDVVVFVVSAANHFTQSAKEFIWAAAAEKAYLFIVVNGYDTIRDKQRCQKLILDQVSGLSPRTFKESSELVHFVSSNAVPSGPPPPGGPGGSGSGSSSGGGGGDDPADDKGKGKDKEKIRDFEALEQSLRRFVLEKRARSKLAPARTYLLNILNDVHTLAAVNQGVAQSELERVARQLEELEPQLELSKKARSEVGDQIDRDIEDTCQEIYHDTRSKLNTAIAQVGEANLNVPYTGLFRVFRYADDLKEAMLSHISDAVSDCEEHARGRSIRSVNSIKQLGILHIGNEFETLQFRPDVMFRRKRDALARQVDVPTELWDFVDWSTLLQRQEKFAGTGMALTVAGAIVPRLLGINNWFDQALTATRVLSNGNMRQLILPGILVAAIAASAYIVQQIPNSLPPRLATKISAQLTDLDYVHANSARISSSVRKVLRYPADNLRVSLDQNVKDLRSRRDDTAKIKDESERASKIFRGLVGESEVQRSMVEAVDLDSPPPGLH
ncbi:hypothetical protein CDD81_1103 [Ophiocordyceps australis]|uniref:Dynamin N-terminal domain-containing protein n=1 Tax=Ophiocordyceps australis TaxID=1399860 RepID=A0A2C5XZM2_9HYPO|nr:hypothetical protein CDD81_1103 [Ophiocordyceps australis]